VFVVVLEPLPQLPFYRTMAGYVPPVDFFLIRYVSSSPPPFLLYFPPPELYLPPFSRKLEMSSALGPQKIQVGHLPWEPPLLLKRLSPIGRPDDYEAFFPLCFHLLNDWFRGSFFVFFFFSHYTIPFWVPRQSL